MSIYTGTSYVTDLLTDLAGDLDAYGIAVWRPDSPYLASELGVSLDGMPEDPPSVLTLTAYLEDTTATYRRDQETDIQYVQFMLRLPTAAAGRNLQDVIRDRYHRRRITLPTVGTVTGRQLSRAPLGPDQNERRLFTQNFTFTGLRART